MAGAAALNPDALAQGCPSGLAPPAEETHARPDPAPFVQTGADGRARLELSVKGAKCAGCLRKIENGLLQLPGVDDARLNLSTGRLTVHWAPGAVDPRDITQTLSRLGYDSAPFDPDASRKRVDEEGRMLLRCMAVAAFASMNVMMFTVPVWSGQELTPITRQTFYLISALIAIPSAIYAGRPFFTSAWKALKHGRANMDVPISIAVFLTLFMSLYETMMGGEHAYFDGVVMLLFLLLIGRWLDHELREKARTAAKDLLALQAVTATRIGADGAHSLVAARDVAVGDRLLLAPGDRAPVDGVIEDGVSEVDRSLITGESEAVSARPGDALHAGVVNLTRPLTLRATATASASTVAELARLIEAGEQRRGGFMRMADQAAALYVPVVHVLAAATFLGWMALTDAGVRVALMNACAVLIITCPCALGLAAPAVQVVATGRLFKRGVFVKSGDALERLAQIDKVVLDKTGTLTMGRPRLTNRDAIAPERLQQAASLARLSRHPLARALVEAAGPGQAAKTAHEVVGEGLEGVIEGQPARLGKRAFAAPVAAPVGDSPGPELWFTLGAQAPVRFAFADAPRPDAQDTIARFAALGLDPELLSGDRADVVSATARDMGMTHATGDIAPAQKVARLEALKANGAKVLMVGDGLNDAPALASAFASASPGTAVDAAQAAADFVFQGAKLGALIETIDVAKKARVRMVENFAFSALYNVVAIPFAMLGFVTPFIAALAMAGSSLVVTLNALRLNAAMPMEER
jgi:Cu2+-exporting ATPase